ncbi:MAG: nucleotidyltransferase domain-containing protein [Candidatus Andersenbacteria bacterium]
MQISKEQQNTIATVAKEHGLKLIVLYGSQAAGKTHAESDVDIAVLADKELSYEEMFVIEEKIGKAINQSQDKIDLVDTRHIPPLLLYNVARKGQLVYGSASEYEALRRQAFKQYIDARPLFKATEKFVKKYVNR